MSESISLFGLGTSLKWPVQIMYFCRKQIPYKMPIIFWEVVNILFNGLLQLGPPWDHWSWEKSMGSSMCCRWIFPPLLSSMNYREKNYITRVLSMGWKAICSSIWNTSSPFFTESGIFRIVYHIFFLLSLPATAQLFFTFS